MEARLFDTALDSVITFRDTAGCYGVSEELIGSTASVERSLKRMKTDHCDLMKLRSRDLSTLRKGEAWDQRT